MFRPWRSKDDSSLVSRFVAGPCDEGSRRKGASEKTKVDGSRSSHEDALASRESARKSLSCRKDASPYRAARFGGPGSRLGLGQLFHGGCHRGRGPVLLDQESDAVARSRRAVAAWVGDGIDRLFLQQPFPVCVVLAAGRAQASHPNARCSAFRFPGALRGFLLYRHEQGSSVRCVFVRQHGAGRLELQRSLKPGCDSDKPNSNSEFVLGVIGPVSCRRRLFRYAQLQRKRRALIAFLLKLCAFIDFAK